jgi:hypothetical protein
MGNATFYWLLMSDDQMERVAARVPRTVPELIATGIMEEDFVNVYGSQLVCLILDFVQKEKGLEEEYLNRPKIKRPLEQERLNESQMKRQHLATKNEDPEFAELNCDLVDLAQVASVAWIKSTPPLAGNLGQWEPGQALVASKASPEIKKGAAEIETVQLSDAGAADPRKGGTTPPQTITIDDDNAGPEPRKGGIEPPQTITIDDDSDEESEEVRVFLLCGCACACVCLCID